MFTVSEAAQKQIKEVFKDREIKPIRIFFSQGGCCGPEMAMAIDEKRDNDSVFEVDGFEYVVDSNLLKQANPINVDFHPNGFVVSSQLTSGGGGCSGCGSGGGSCC